MYRHCLGEAGIFTLFCDKFIHNNGRQVLRKTLLGFVEDITKIVYVCFMCASRWYNQIIYN